MLLLLYKKNMDFFFIFDTRNFFNLIVIREDFHLFSNFFFFFSVHNIYFFFYSCNFIRDYKTNFQVLFNEFYLFG